MNKRLDQMNNKELGKLFPIIISKPNPNWISLFKKEKNEIENVLGKDYIIRIEHIGGTAVPNLKSKPIVDILIEVQETIVINKIIERLISLGYQYILKPENPAPHMMFAKGYTIDGFKGQAYHIHVRYKGDWDELYFRDYLKMNPIIAKEYGELKIRLAKKYRNNREEYTDKKTDFIKRITEKAKNEKIK